MFFFIDFLKMKTEEHRPNAYDHNKDMQVANNLKLCHNTRLVYEAGDRPTERPSLKK